MATYGHTFTSGDTVTPTKLNNARTVSDIVSADIKSDAAIAGTKIVPAFGAQDITVNTANRSITNTTNHALAFGTNNTERMRIANNGQVIIGHNAPVSVTGSLGFEGLQVHGLGSVPSATFSRWTNDSAGPNMSFVKSSSGTVGSLGGVVASGNTLGNITWLGDDGTSAVSAAQIAAQVDGTPGTNDMPGRLVFSTTADGGSSPTERMRIQADGKVGIGTTSPSYLLDVAGIVNTDTNFAVDGTKVVGSRVTGWSAATGTATRTAFATSSVTTAQLAERVKALIDDLRTHGLLGN